MPETRLYAKLVATTAVTDIVVTRIFPIRSPQGAALPYVTYQTITDEPVNDSAGTTTSGVIRVQVDLWAETYIGVKALAAAVQAALNGWATNDAILPAIAMSHLLSSVDLAEPSDPGQDATTFRVSQDYQLDYQAS